MNDADETYKALMEATRQTLASKGYEGLTMRAVAGQADKSRGLLHYHFENKDDLVYSLLDHLLERMTASIRDPNVGNPVQELQHILKWNAYGPDREPSGGDNYFLAIFALRARAPFDDEIRHRLTRNYQQVVNECAAVIAGGIEDGTFRPVGPEETAVFLVTAVDGARNTDLTLERTDTRQVVFEAIDQYIIPALTIKYNFD
ncbi:TetR/AcrR family transcriptional regulator [Natrinema sp. SYSU A 869]|uniref:TetR/AcrR family transcriptional regulator n=1 Tax=Natrinema sp. SYSU A 869 TaxID=2871694 RepID=UPI001CA44A54|nr:TetR/AcrR family transcriptional regulator [Natrinema sp. SYSU A 869]